MWVKIPGYLFDYRINEDGEVEKLEDDGWRRLKKHISGKTRACVKMRTVDRRKVDVPVNWLMADAFMGGKKEGMAIIHKNGMKMDCCLSNLKMVPQKECGRLSCYSKRKAVFKLNQSGEVVAVYASGREAAQKNFISQNSIWARCQNQVADRFRLDGFDYCYEEDFEERVKGADRNEL